MRNKVRLFLILSHALSISLLRNLNFAYSQIEQDACGQDQNKACGQVDEGQKVHPSLCEDSVCTDADF